MDKTTNLEYTLKVHKEREEAFIRSAKLYTKGFKKVEDDSEHVLFKVKMLNESDLFYFGQNVETANIFIKWLKSKKEDGKRENKS